MKQNLSAFVVGLIFAVGLGISGMTQPQKVIGFLDLTAWNPSLIFVMVGAILVHAAVYPLVRRRPSPLLAESFQVPSRREISPSLLAGAFLFGLGWGIGGYCPGPAITSLSSGTYQVLLFVAMMLIGMLVYRKAEPYIPLRK